MIWVVLAVFVVSVGDAQRRQIYILILKGTSKKFLVSSVGMMIFCIKMTSSFTKIHRLGMRS